MIIVIEPLNAWIDHPGLFLTKIPQAYQDLPVGRKPQLQDHKRHLPPGGYTEGNLIPNIDLAWNEIAAFHVGDNPGRKEPTTGEINYRNVFKHLHRQRL